MGAMSGGQAFTEFFPISADHGTVTTTAYLTLANQVKTSITKDGLSLDTVQCDPTTIGKLEDAAAAGGGSSSTEAEKVLNEKGVETSAGAAASGAQQYLAITYGGAYESDLEVIVQVGTFNDDSGDRDIEHKKLTRPKAGFTATAALQAITIPNACLQTASPALVVAPTVPYELPSGRKRKSFFPVAGADA